MDVVAPIIYSRTNVAARCSLGARCVSGLISLAAVAVLLTAAWLRPSHAGLSTHEELGLPACGFLEHYGYPCPGCGLTTSFSWFVRGNLAASLYVQPMGTLLAALTGATMWIGLYILVTGRPVYRLLQLFNTQRLLVGLFAFGIVAWGWKILIHCTHHDGW